MVNIIDPANPTRHTVVATGFLLKPNLSTIADVNASIIEIEDDKPATTRHRKNIAPNRLPPGIRLTALG